jgi:hypothetical protein
LPTQIATVQVICSPAAYRVRLIFQLPCAFTDGPSEIVPCCTHRPAGEGRLRYSLGTTKLNRPSVAIFWVARGYGDAAIRSAKEAAGEPITDTVTAIEALRHAALRHRVMLTDHLTAMARADDAVAQLEAAMAEMRRTGQLQIFNQMYRMHRDAAGKRGRQEGPARHGLSNRLEPAAVGLDPAPDRAGGADGRAVCGSFPVMGLLILGANRQLKARLGNFLGNSKKPVGNH